MKRKQVRFIGYRVTVGLIIVLTMVMASCKSGGTVTTSATSAWSVMDNATEPLYAVWSSSATDVFAVGYSGTILHYDGHSWSTMSSGVTDQLLNVWGSSATDVFAVGWEDNIILHYNGSGWSTMSSGTVNKLPGVWGNSATDVFVVGKDGVILHYNGSAWSTMNSVTSIISYGEVLNSIWGSSATNVFAVGGMAPFCTMMAVLGAP